MQKILLMMYFKKFIKKMLFHPIMNEKLVNMQPKLSFLGIFYALGQKNNIFKLFTLHPSCMYSILVPVVDIE